MGRQPFRTLLGCVAFAATATFCVPAVAATSRPDAHDRALARQLDARVATFRAIAKQRGSGETTSLDTCPYLKQHPNQAFAAAFALLPVLLAQFVDAFKPEIVSLQATVAGLHPHSPLFTRWLSAMGGEFTLILSFDNHGKKVDLCDAAVVLLNKKSTAAEIERVTGLDPGLFARLFTSPVQGKLSKLDPRMKTFFVQAGLSAKDATTLTS